MTSGPSKKKIKYKYKLGAKANVSDLGSAAAHFIKHSAVWAIITPIVTTVLHFRRASPLHVQQQHLVGHPPEHLCQLALVGEGGSRDVCSSTI